MQKPEVRFTSASVALPISNWDVALAWYLEVLGCHVSRVDVSIGEVLEVRFGLQRFSLWLDWGDPLIPLAARGEARSPILTLGVRSLASARKALSARGAKLSRTPTGFWSLEDPFGNQLLLFQEPSVRQTAALRRRLVDYLRDSESHRRVVAEAMQTAGVKSFETVSARRAFMKQHGIRMPRPPRR